MKKNLLFSALLFFVATSLFAQPRGPQGMGQIKRPKTPENVVFQYSDTVRFVTKLNFNGPLFLVYPDAAMSAVEAEEFVNELGLKDIVTKYAGSISVIKPIGADYDKIIDFEAYKNFVESCRVIGNLKVLGFGRGATFVNNVIAPVANEIAGIFTYGGKMSAKSISVPVPAYIALGNSQHAKVYAKANDAVLMSRGAKHIVYENAEEPLQKVVLSLEKNATKAEAFADAWEMVLSKNYRYSNFKHTHYMGAKFGQYGAYELEPRTDFEALGIKRIAHKEKLSGPDFRANQKAFWYEYVPEKCETAPAKSVPLVVLLHGHQNDNRTQSETSGFAEVAALEGLMLAEIEWQGNGGMNGSDMYIGVGGIEQIILGMFERYPQIDPSRVYCQGLSAGSMHTCSIGVEKSYLFAAVAGHSGGIFDNPVYGFSPQGLFMNARQKRGNVEMPLLLCAGTDDDTIGFPTKENYKGNPYYNALNLYSTLNGMSEVIVDFDEEPVLGIKLENRETVTTNKHITLESGDLCKGGIPLIRFTAIVNYGHWNFRPMAQRMWEFFSHYRRDPETGKLYYK